MDVGTQTEKSYVRNTRKPKEEPKQDAKPPEPPVQEIKNKILSCDFEVFGIVQDVSFRHYTHRRAQKLEVRGWCMNSENNTVLGVIQGLPHNFEAMRLWLAYTGSPTSRIDKCVFGGTLELDEFTFEEFSIRYT